MDGKHQPEDEVIILYHEMLNMMTHIEFYCHDPDVEYLKERLAKSGMTPKAQQLLFALIDEVYENGDRHRGDRHR